MPTIPDNVVYVAVGSLNPVKVGATRAVLQRLVPNIRIEGIAVESGVPDQPWGDEETIAGAQARAERARATLDADWGVGIEGGVVATPGGGVRTCAWAVVVNRAGRVGVGGSLSMELPARVAELLRGGLELGQAMDQVSGRHNVKQGLGAVGILTAGAVTRQAAYESLVAYAMVPLLERSRYSTSA